MISFFAEDIDFELAHQEEVAAWLSETIETHDKELVEITYIFCSDSYLHQINMDYLNHDTYTDIITFDNSESEDKIESDIFVSIDRVKENAQTFEVSFERELHRVMIHGVLHLLGFKDKTDAQSEEMRRQEDTWLEKLEL